MDMKRRILVADSSAANRASLREILEDQFLVSEAADAASALALLLRQGRRVQAVLLDIGPDGLDGLALLRRIRAEKALSRLPVILAIASGDAWSEAEVLRQGADDFVTKPYVPEVVLRRVSSAVNTYFLEERSSSRALRELTQRADFDPLTGIRNKDAFYRVTREMLDAHPEQAFALVRWNVERFKLINDLYGQETGDRVLREIADCLKETLPGDATCGRLSSDHFAFCLPRAELRPEDRVADATRRFRRLGIHHDIFVDAGVYEIEDPALPVSQMCDRANLALQTINGKYNQHVARYTSALRSAMLREQEIRNQMGGALLQGQFQVYYQPICSLSSGRPVGAEALVRWIHPQQGVISPGEFIPLFEKSGFITELDRYVWEEVCRYLSRRSRQGLPSLPISVNASRASLYDSGFCEEILSLTRRYGVDPGLFKIEITETAYADNPEQILSAAQRLQAAGHAILMDDFGSGYSSLNTLKDIPVDTLKIDMKFLQGFEEGGRVGTVLISVLRMAKWLNTPVVAEGVETADQMAFLRSVGCDWIQGYCYARPMPPAEFEDYLALAPSPVPEKRSAAFSARDFDLLMGGNQLINRLMEGMFGGFGLYEFSDGRLEVIRVNDGYYEILGLTPAAIHGASGSLLGVRSPEDVEEVRELCREAIRSGRTVRRTLRRRRTTGRILCLDCLFRWLGGDEGGALLCVAFNDITDRLETERQMREEQGLYRTILERTGAIVAEWDLTRRTFSASPGFEQFSVSRGDPFALLEQEPTMGGLERPDMDGHVLVREQLLHRADGTAAWYRLVRADVRDEAGRLLRVVGTLTDIGREKQAQQEAERTAALRRALDRAEEAVLEKERFLSHASHEIRTPMNAIIGMAGLALADPKVSGRTRIYLQRIQSAGEYTLTLTGDILDVSQAENGELPLAPAPCSLRDYAEQLAALVEPCADSMDVRFQLDSSQLPERTAVMDRSRVLHIFVNLLTGVIECTAGGGLVSCVMSQTASGESGFLLRTVIRSSTGLSREFTDRLREALPAERSGLSGSALALTLARRLLEAMGGTLSVTEGTALVAELPVQEAAEPARPSSLPPLAGAFNFAGRRILAAEAPSAHAEAVRRLLEDKQFTVDTAASGREAADRFRSCPQGWYSAIVMDVRLPVLDGPAAVREIRRMDRPDARTIPIIAVTDSGSDADVQAALAAGMDAHLEKPLSPYPLYQTLAALIFAREGREQQRESEKRIRQQERIYKLLLAQSRSQVFDYDAQEDQLTISTGGKEQEGVSIVTEFVRKVLPICAVVHPDYRQEMGRILSDEEADGDGELLFLGDFHDTGYRWYNAFYKRLGTGDSRRVVGRIDDVDEKTRRTMSLREKAEFDPITGLYNRATFQELVQNALGGRDPEIDGAAAFVEFDLDNFKLVNDTCGHLAGDRLLKTVGDAVRNCCRREDLVGRLGGDEFAIWMEDVGNADNVTEKIRRLGRKIREATAPLQLGMEITASFGIAMAAPSDKAFEELFQKADVAMYQAKRTGKNGWSVYGGQSSGA